MDDLKGANAVPNEIETAEGRLILRRFESSDFESYAEYHQLETVYRYLYQDVPSEVDLRRNFENALKVTWENDGDTFRLAVVRKSDSAFLGEVLLKLASKAARQAEVGYIFNPRFSGQGYATEAVNAIVGLGFQILGMHRIFARLDAKNSGSVGVVERLRFRREAHLIENDQFNGIWGDEYIYAILEKDWTALSR